MVYAVKVERQLRRSNCIRGGIDRWPSWGGKGCWKLTCCGRLGGRVWYEGRCGGVVEQAAGGISPGAVLGKLDPLLVQGREEVAVTTACADSGRNRVVSRGVVGKRVERSCSRVVVVVVYWRTSDFLGQCTAVQCSWVYS